jgi:hypothetical protein
LTDTIDSCNGAPVAITPDSKVVPKRSGPKGMLPNTWSNRSLRLEYVVCGELRATTGTLLDVYPAGPVVNASGVRTLIA